MRKRRLQSTSSTPVTGATTSWAILMPLLVVFSGVLVQYAMAYVSGREVDGNLVAGVAVKAIGRRPTRILSVFATSVRGSTPKTVPRAASAAACPCW